MSLCKRILGSAICNRSFPASGPNQTAEEARSSATIARITNPSRAARCMSLFVADFDERNGKPLVYNGCLLIQPNRCLQLPVPGICIEYFLIRIFSKSKSLVLFPHPPAGGFRGLMLAHTLVRGFLYLWQNVFM